jgi:hypothetical protein
MATRKDRPPKGTGPQLSTPTDTASVPEVCASGGCDRLLNRKTAVWTREGWYCRRHAAHLPPYLLRPRRVRHG